MPAQVDDTNYDIWLEHSSAKVPYRLARDENDNVMLNTGSAQITSAQIFSGSFSLDNTNVDVNSPIAFQDWTGGAGFFEADLEDPVGRLVYYKGTDIDTSWPGVAYISPKLNTGESTTQAAIKFVNSSLGLFVMTTRYVLEWTGAAWTSRLDVGASNTNTDLVEFVDASGNVILLLGVANAAYYTSTDGINWTQQGGTAGTMPAYRASAIQTATGTTSVSIGAPAGLVDNDIMIAAVSTLEWANTITAPAGWTQLYHQPIGTGMAASFWWKRAASESGSYTFSTTYGNTNWKGSISAYSGVITTGNPVEGSGFSNNSGTGTTTPVTGSTTVATANTAAIVIYLTPPASSVTATAPTNYTENYDNTGVSFNLKTATPSVGSIGPITGALSGSVEVAGGLIILTTAAAGTSSFTDITRFALRGQSNGSPLLWAVDSAGDFRNTPDPLTGSAWSAADTTRLGAGATILGLEVVDNVFYLFHNKGITSYDGTTVATVWNNTNIAVESTAARPFTWVDKSIYFTLSGTLFKYSADQLAIERVWPRSGQTGNTDLNGTITAITGDAANLWFVLKNAAGTSYIMKCNPYSELTYKGEAFMPVHSLISAGSSTVQGIIVVPGASHTLSTTNPQVIYGNSTVASYFLLPKYNKEPKDDSDYQFSTSGGTLYGSWIRGPSKTFNKFLNNITSVGITMSGTSYIATYYAKDYSESSSLLQTATTDGITRTGLSSDIEFSNLKYSVIMDTASATTSPRLLAVSFDTSINPPRMRQWEMYIEVANDTEMLGGGESRHGARYLDNHLFTGLTERVTFYDRLGNSFITKILDVTSQVRGEDVDVYKVTLVQLV